MQKVTFTSDWKLKTEAIAMHLWNAGSFCHSVKNFEKSLELTNKATLLLKSNFGDDVHKYKLFAYCIKNCVIVLKEYNYLFEAVQLCEKVLDSVDEVSDWKSNEEKKEFRSSISELHKDASATLKKTFRFALRNFYQFVKHFLRNFFLFLMLVCYYLKFSDKFCM